MNIYYAHITARCLYIYIYIVRPMSFPRKFANVAILAVSRSRLAGEGRSFNVCMIHDRTQISLTLSSSSRLPLFYVSAIVIKSAGRTGRGLLQLLSTFPRSVSLQRTRGPLPPFFHFPLSSTLLCIIPYPLLRCPLSPVPRHCPYVMKRA